MVVNVVLRNVVIIGIVAIAAVMMVHVEKIITELVLKKQKMGHFSVRIGFLINYCRFDCQANGTYDKMGFLLYLNEGKVYEGGRDVYGSIG